MNNRIVDRFRKVEFTDEDFFGIRLTLNNDDYDFWFTDLFSIKIVGFISVAGPENIGFWYNGSQYTSIYEFKDVHNNSLYNIANARAEDMRISEAEMKALGFTLGD